MIHWPILSNLRVRFVLLALLGVLPALALLLYSASEQRDATVVTAQNEARRFVRLAAADQERLFESSNQLLAVVARFPELRVDGPDECNNLLSSLIGDYPAYANIGVIEPDGALRCSAIPADSDISLADREYFRRALETESFALGDFQIGRVTNQATVNVGYPVFDEGNVVEVLFAAIDLAELNRFASNEDLPEDSFLLVLDRNGTVLARHPEPDAWVGESLRGTPVVERVLTEQFGFAEFADMDGKEYLFVYTPLLETQGTPSAFIVLAQPREIVLASANTTFNRNLGRLGVVSILALVAAWVGADVFARRGPENRKRLVLRFYSAFNTGNPADLEVILAPDFVDHDPKPGQLPGVEGIRELVVHFRSAFPDGTIVADNIAIDGHTVIAWVTLTGTQTEEFYGELPGHTRVQAKGIETFVLEKGKIAEIWSVFTDLQPIPESSEIDFPSPQPIAEFGDPATQNLDAP